MSFAVLLRGLAAAMILAVLTPFGGLAAITGQEEVATIRSGDHPGFGRVTIDTNARAAYHVDQTGDRVIVRFLSPVVLGKPPSAPRNVVAIRTSDQTIELTIKSGSTIRSGRIGDRFFVDIIEPGQTSAARQARTDSDRTPPRKPAGQPPVLSSLATSPELGGRPGKQTTSGQAMSGSQPTVPSAAAPSPPATATAPTAAPTIPPAGPSARAC